MMMSSVATTGGTGQTGYQGNKSGQDRGVGRAWWLVVIVVVAAGGDKTEQIIHLISVTSM